jgi:outer membrane protein TolC
MNQVLARAVLVSPELQIAKLEVERMIRRLAGVRMKYFPEFNIVTEMPRLLDYEEERKAKKPTDFRNRTENPGVSVEFDQHLPSNTDVGAYYDRDISDRGVVNENIGIEFSQELLRKDPVGRERDIAVQRVWLEEQAEAAIQREFVYRVKSAYFNAVEAGLTRDNAVVRNEQDKLYAEESEKKFTSGIIAEYMVLDYRRDWEQSRSRLVVRRAAMDRARNELLYLLKLPFDSKVTFRDIPEPDIDRKLCEMRRMIDAGLRSALNIAQLRFNLFSNAENLEYLRNSLLPSVKLRAGIHWDGTHDTVGGAPDVDSREMSAGLLISIPLFRDQFTKSNNIMLEQMDHTINEISLTDQFRAMVRNVRNDLESVEELRQRHEIALRIYEITSRDYELARLRFDVGNVGSWDMIRSKNEYFGALDDLITLRYSLLRRLAVIERDYPMLATDGGGV